MPLFFHATAYPANKKRPQDFPHGLFDFGLFGLLCFAQFFFCASCRRVSVLRTDFWRVKDLRNGRIVFQELKHPNRSPAWFIPSGFPRLNGFRRDANDGSKQVLGHSHFTAYVLDLMRRKIVERFQDYFINTEFSFALLVLHDLRHALHEVVK